MPDQHHIHFMKNTLEGFYSQPTGVRAATIITATLRTNKERVGAIMVAGKMPEDDNC